jgi:hypothetical protein
MRVVDQEVERTGFMVVTKRDTGKGRLSNGCQATGLT